MNAGRTFATCFFIFPIMATKNSLPNNDPDLMLAQAIGKSIESGSSLSDIDDNLVHILVGYKEKELADTLITKEISDSLWNTIESETHKKPAKITPLFSRSSTFAWASAAVLLIAAFFGFYWITLQPQLELVAESGHSIEIITLDDGTEVTMRPNSKLHRKITRKETRNYILEGEAFFDVITNTEIPFSVDGEYGTVTVLGTRFNLSTWGGTTIVYLEEGSVSLTSKSDNESVILSPGQSSQILNGDIEILAQSNAEEFTDWISNIIVFNASNPTQVISEISQHFGVSIDISSAPKSKWYRWQS